MSVQRFDLYRATPTVVGHVNTIHLINQSVTGPAGADGAGVSVATKEGGTTKVAVTTVLDFDGTNFDVTGSSGTASIAIAAGQYDPSGTASSAISSHLAAGDPHAQYALESALGTAAAAAVGDFATAAQGATADGAIPKALVDAKGDLLVASADNTPARLAVGTDGHVLTADAAEATGVKWAAAAGGSDPLDGNSVIATRILAR